jgi:hypothetical protein
MTGSAGLHLFIRACSIEFALIMDRFRGGTFDSFERGSIGNPALATCSERDIEGESPG